MTSAAFRSSALAHLEPSFLAPAPRFGHLHEEGEACTIVVEPVLTLRILLDESGGLEQPMVLAASGPI